MRILARLVVPVVVMAALGSEAATANNPTSTVNTEGVSLLTSKPCAAKKFGPADLFLNYPPRFVKRATRYDAICRFRVRRGRIPRDLKVRGTSRWWPGRQTIRSSTFKISHKLNTKKGQVRSMASNRKKSRRSLAIDDPPPDARGIEFTFQPKGNTKITELRVECSIATELEWDGHDTAPQGGQYCCACGDGSLTGTCEQLDNVARAADVPGACESACKKAGLGGPDPNYSYAGVCTTGNVNTCATGGD